MLLLNSIPRAGLGFPEIKLRQKTLAKKRKEKDKQQQQQHTMTQNIYKNFVNPLME